MNKSTFFFHVRNTLYAAGCAILLVACGGDSNSPTSTAALDPVASIKPEQIKAILAKTRGTGPGLAGGIISDSAIVLAADGKLSSDGPAPLTPENWLHLGSNSKSMTAMAIGVQVEKGNLKWTDTLETLFPELAASMRPDYRKRTLLDVLSFRAGFAPMLQFAEFAQVPIASQTMPEQRLEYARWLFAQPAINVAGTVTEYSNSSYVLAGAIVERASGKPFEQTMQETVLGPLGLRGKYGLPQTVSADQPAAHLQVSPDVFEPIAPDNPLVLAVPTYLNSAGLLSMPVSDYARYAQIHLQALRGKPTLLKAETYKILHTPLEKAGSDVGMALAWYLTASGSKKQYEFTGSIDVMSAHIRIVPADNRAIIVLNNYDAGDKLDALITQSATELLALQPAK